MSTPWSSRCIVIAVWFAGVIFFWHTAVCTFIFKRLYATEAGAQTAVKNISPGQAREIIEKAKDGFILDVRTQDEYNEFHLKGANLIPIQELEKNINKIPKDKIVVVYCARGKRSAKACEILKDKGLKELYNVEGGVNQWKAEGFPVEKSQ
ncbi:MAG: rhodanese-like domain-containing protein [Candidatus Brocadia sp.]|nr:rhodanese-like domain-containing protein [Candidatus Brocadia sp.]